MVIFFYNPAMINSKEPDVYQIVKKCDQYNIPVATNIATAESLILGLDRGRSGLEGPVPGRGWNLMRVIAGEMPEPAPEDGTGHGYPSHHGPHQRNAFQHAEPLSAGLPVPGSVQRQRRHRDRGLKPWGGILLFCGKKQKSRGLYPGEPFVYGPGGLQRTAGHGCLPGGGAAGGPGTLPCDLYGSSLQAGAGETGAGDRTGSCVGKDTLILVEASLDTDFQWIETSGFEISRIKKYKTNAHLFLRRRER